MTLAVLLHMLVFVFWVGGDLGAFLASFTVGDPREPAPARLAAARLIEAVDMAPRTCLVAALPTGLTLGWRLGLWPGWACAAGWALAVPWLGAVWAIHLRGADEAPGLARADQAMRLAVIAGCAAAGGAILAGLAPLPAFIGLKLLLLAGAIGCGVAIRTLLLPFAPAFRAALADAADAAAQARTALLLRRVRLAVIGIWALVTAAACVGIDAAHG